MRSAAGSVIALLTTVALALASCSAEERDRSSDSTSGPVAIGDRSIYLTCSGEKRNGAPTVILVSGYHDSSDVWTQADVLTMIGAAKGPPVFEALAASHHVCAYDRPGTLRYIEGTPLTDRTTPVQQPRTVRDIVDELSALIEAAEVPKPLVLVGHSLGGLIVQLFARLHPDLVHGVVFVDPFSATVPSQFGPLWPAYRDKLLNPPIDEMPLPSMRSPESERVDLDASAAQTLSAPPLPPKPLVVLTKTESFAGLKSLPGLPADDVNRLYERAERSVVELAPATPQILATGSDHYIQFSQPDLIVSATELVLGR
jgi:pimeloyl-ACP methyl ester carboxylesterase